MRSVLGSFFCFIFFSLSDQNHSGVASYPRVRFVSFRKVLLAVYIPRGVELCGSRDLQISLATDWCSLSETLGIDFIPSSSWVFVVQSRGGEVEIVRFFFPFLSSLI